MGFRLYDLWDWTANRDEVISPYLSMYEKTNLVETVKHELCSFGQRLNEVMTNKYLTIEEYRENYSKLEALESKIYQLFSSDLIADIYNLYYLKSKDQYYTITDKNIQNYKILELINNSGVKILTNSSYTTSLLFTVEICKAIYQSLIDTLLKESPNDCQSNKDKTPEKFIQETIENEIKNISKNAFEKALDKIKLLEENEIDLRKLDQSLRENSSAPNPIQLVNCIAKGLNLSKENIKSIVGRILDKSNGLFNEKAKFYENDIFDSHDLSELEGLEYLNPIFRRVKWDDVYTLNKRTHGKVNVYLDISGSMTETCYIGGRRTKKGLVAKSICSKLTGMKLIHNLILFNNFINRVIENPTPADIFSVSERGGTSINIVIRDCIERGENAIIITDCEDVIRMHSERCIIIGTPDSRISCAKNIKDLWDEGDQLWKLSKENEELIRM